MPDMIDDPINTMLAERERQGFAPQEQRYLPPAPLGSTAITVDTGVISAQRVAVARDDTRIFLKIKAAAAAAGMEWFYSWETKNKDGTRTEISGPTIKCANSVSRLYGNCAVDCRAVDDGTHVLFLARFVDIETGYQLTRPFRQRKSQATFGDVERQQDIAFQIGASKAIRNVICNALETYVDYAFREARNLIVEKIGKNLDEYRNRVLSRLKDMNIAVGRIERVRGKVAASWLAKDVASLIAEIQSIQEGMAMADDIWPVGEPGQAGAAPAEDRPTRQARKPREAKETPKPAEDQQSGADPQEGQQEQTGADAQADQQPADQPDGDSFELVDPTTGQIDVISDADQFADALIAMLESSPDLNVAWSANPKALAMLTDAGRPDLVRLIQKTDGKLQEAREKAKATRARKFADFWSRPSYLVPVNADRAGVKDLGTAVAMLCEIHEAAETLEEVAKVHRDNLDTVKLLVAYKTLAAKYEVAYKGALVRLGGSA